MKTNTIEYVPPKIEEHVLSPRRVCVTSGGNETVNYYEYGGWA